jgi:hypothetical protein
MGMISIITSAVCVVVIGIIVCVQNVFAGLAVIIVGGLILGTHFYTYTNSTRSTRKVISGELLTKAAVRKRIYYVQKTYILKLLLNIITVSNEALVLWGNNAIFFFGGGGGDT